MAAREPVPVRSFRAVIDDVERRIYRVDRWRLPMPGGIEVRAILYTVASFVALAAAGNLPLFGAIVGELPAGIRYLALPVLCGWGLSAWRIDGRAPHHALTGVVRFAFRARTLAGLRRTDAVGAAMAPLAAVGVAPAGDEATYRRGRVQGPARLTLRYPARIESGAKRLRVEAAGERVRPLPSGQELQVPDGAEVLFG